MNWLRGLLDLPEFDAPCEWAREASPNNLDFAMYHFQRGAQWANEESQILSAVIQEMVTAGESACFIGQVLKLHFTRTNFTALHFWEGDKEKAQHAFDKACKYSAKL